jgi:hypothetical protein
LRLIAKAFVLSLGIAAAAIVLWSLVPASASIIFLPGNHPQKGEENIMFEAPDLIPNTTQTGDTNRSNSPVIFDTTFTAGSGSTGLSGSGQFIVADGIGQANLICTVGGTPCTNNGGNESSQLNSLEMKPGPGLAWTDVIANPDFGVGTMNVFVQDNLGSTNFDFALGKGNDFFTLVATGGEVITDVQMSQEVGTAGPFGWNDFKQPRVSGICVLQTGGSCVPLLVPEPSALPLTGLGTVGAAFVAAFWRRRKEA